MSIVVGYSDTAEGRAALRRALAESELRGQPVAVLDLTPTKPGTTRDADGPAAAAVRELGASSRVTVTRRDPRQDVAAALLDHAVEQQASLVVIGTRRRSPVGKLLLGSTAQRVLLDAEVPVLVVKVGQDE